MQKFDEAVMTFEDEKMFSNDYKYNPDEDYTDEELEKKLKYHIKQKISRVHKDLKSSPLYRKTNPTSLRSRIAMLDSDSGINSLNEMENEYMCSTETDECRNYEKTIQKLMRQSLYDFTIMLTRMQTTNHILRLTLNQ